MGGECLHVLNQDVLGTPVVENQSEGLSTDHTTGAWRLEIAGPELGIIEGMSFKRDIERLEEGLALGIE
jgi:hypothetical protein